MEVEKESKKSGWIPINAEVEQSKDGSTANEDPIEPEVFEEENVRTTRSKRVFTCDRRPISTDEERNFINGSPSGAPAPTDQNISIGPPERNEGGDFIDAPNEDGTI